MVTYYLKGPIQSIQKTTEIVHILEDLYLNLSLLDLCNFDAAMENRKLNAYLNSASEFMFYCEDEWLESSIRI